MRIALDSSRVRFGCISKDDVRRIYSDDHVTSMCCNDFDSFTSEAIEKYEHVGVYVDDELAGMFYYDRISPLEIELHFAFFAGYAVFSRLITILYIKSVFDEGLALRVTAFVYDYRRKVVNMLLKIGFKYEGFMRKCAIKNGTWYGKHVFGILKGDI